MAEQEVQVYQAPRELTLPDRAYLERELKAIREFQQVVQQLFVKDHDYGVIPGTGKPSMLKPGAEKMAKLLGLADTYEFADKVEDWDRPFFRYVVKCKLISLMTGAVVAESFGECNSWESRYRWRWVFKNQLPAGESGMGLVQRQINTKNGRAAQWRMENEDIHSQVNTLIKMAQKRALVGAALSAGRLSDVFTQDMEDMPGRDDSDVLDAEYREVPKADATRQQAATPRQTSPAPQSAVAPDASQQTGAQPPQTAPADQGDDRIKVDVRMKVWIMEHLKKSTMDAGIALLDGWLSKDHDTTVAGFQALPQEKRDAIMTLMANPGVAAWLAEELKQPVAAG